MFNLAATLVSLVAGFLVSVIIARLLGPAGSGAVAFAMWLAVCASAIADRGLPQIVLRHVAALEDDGSRRALVGSALKAFAPAVAFVFLLFLGYGLHRQANGTAEPWLWQATALLFLVYAFSAFSIAAARGRGKFSEAAANTAVGSIVQVPLVFAGALLLGPAGALLAMISRYLPQVLSLPRHFRMCRSSAEGRLTPQMLRYGRSMWASDVVDIVLLARIEYLVLGFFLSNADVGYFAAAVVFAGLVGQLTLQLSPIFLVRLSQSTPDAASKEARDRLYRNGVRMAAFFVMPLGLGGAVVIPHLLPMVFGSAFAPSAPAAALLLLATVPAGLAIVPWTYLAANGHGGSLLRLTLVSAAVMLVLLWTVVPVAGIFGAAMVRGAAEILTLVLLVSAVRAKGGPGLPWGAVARTGAAALCSAAGAFAVLHAVSGVFAILLALGAGATLYAVAVRLFGLMEPREAAALVELAGAKLPLRLRDLFRRCVMLLARAE